MRIKSYFAPSVQSAISIARREFGDDVTLVTSHTASLDSRHLGDYEVVFAVEENSADPLPVAKSVELIKAAAPAAVVPEPVALEPAPAPTSFNDLFEEAVVTPLSTEQNLPGKLEQVETLLLEMGIDGVMVRALMTMIERTTGIPAPAPAPVLAVVTDVEPSLEAIAEAPEPEPPVAAKPNLPDLTPAELEFYLSVSVGA